MGTFNRTNFIMEVTIIIINYNTFQLTYNCIQSVIKNTIGIDYEIILVDNASTECSPDKFKEQYPQITLIKSPINLGFAKGNNLGIKEAKGKYILLLNSDTELINNAIKIGYEKLNTEPTIGVLTCKLIHPNGQPQSVCQRFPTITLELIELLRLHKLISLQKQGELLLGSFFSYEYSIYPDWVWGTFFMFRKVDLQKLTNQQLCEDFFMYGEDMEWCYQFKMAHLRTYYCADAQIVHHLGKSGFGDNFKKDIIIQNEIKTLKKYKGLFYTFVIRLLKSLKFLIQSLKNKSCYRIAKLYLN